MTPTALHELSDIVLKRTSSALEFIDGLSSPYVWIILLGKPRWG